jgi:hypothetical protein
MSFLNLHKGISLAVAIAGGGALGGCAIEDAPDQGMSWQYHLSSGGWDLKGNVFGGGGFDEATDVLVGPNGLIYVSGYENGTFGQSSVDPSGNARGIINAYEYRSASQSLEKVSGRTFGSSHSSAEVIEALALHPSASGSSFDIYFAGRTNGPYAGTHAGQFDTFAGWLPPSGNSPRIQQGTVRPQHPRRLVVTASRDLIIGGYDDIYIPSNFVEAWEDPFVTKVRRSGAGLTPVAGWPIYSNTPNSDVVLGMAAAPHDGAPIYLAGTTLTGSGRGMFVKKFGADGALEWHSQQSPVGLDVAAALAVLPDDNVLFAGATYLQLGEQSFGEQDAVVRLLTPNNQVLWTKQYGTEFSEILTDMTVDAAGDIYLVGETLGSFDPLVPNQGESDIFVLKLSPNGDLKAAFQLGSEGDDHPSSIAVGADGNIYVAGYTTAKLFANRDHVGGRDGFVFRVTAPSIGTF